MMIDQTLADVLGRFRTVQSVVARRFSYVPRSWCRDAGTVFVHKILNNTSARVKAVIEYFGNKKGVGARG
jgi:hypothetical protein